MIKHAWCLKALRDCIGFWKLRQIYAVSLCASVLGPRLLRDLKDSGILGLYNLLCSQLYEPFFENSYVESTSSLS